MLGKWVQFLLYRSQPVVRCKRRLNFFISCTALPLLSGLVLAGNVMAEPLQGPAFSDLEHTEELPSEWRGKMIERSQWSPVGAPPVDLAVTLDQHLYPALKPLIHTFAKTNGLRIAIQEGTCGISAGKLIDKAVDIGGFCCPPGETDRLPGVRYHALGIAALALLVHPENGQQELTLAEARSIFQGEIRSWVEVKQSAGKTVTTKIRPIVRLHCKTRPGHWRLLLDNEDMFGPHVYEVSTIPDMISRVARQKEAIGYETLWMAEQYRDKGSVKVLRLDGVSPTDDDAVAKGLYPLYRTYNITTWTDDITRNSDAEKLAKYLSDNFHNVDPRYGIIPSSILREHGWRFHHGEIIGEPES